jgi:hypothetical protein
LYSSGNLGPEALDPFPHLRVDIRQPVLAQERRHVAAERCVQSGDDLGRRTLVSGRPRAKRLDRPLRLIDRDLE